MKKAFFAVFFLILFHSHSPAQPDEVNKLHGSTRPIRSIRFVSPYQTSVVFYNRQGKRTESTQYNPDGSIQHTSSYTYNEEGLMTGWKEYYGKGTASAEGIHKHAVFTYRAGRLVEVVVYREGSVAHKAAYAYDDRGNKIRETNSGPDANFTSRNYKYDSAGNLIEEVSTGTSYSVRVERVFDEMNNALKERVFDNGVLAFDYNRTYEKGRLIKEEAFSAARRVTTTTLNIYNSAGKLVESTVSRPNLTSKTTIEYDEAGGWAKKKETLTTVKGDGLMSSHDPSPGRSVIKYNERGAEIERVNYSESGALLSRQTSSFDAQGRPIESVFYKPDGAVKGKQVYEYDQYGNRIKTISVTVSPQGEVQNSTLEQRFISYY